MNTGMFEEDEPALRDSLLLLDTNLEDPDHDSSMEVVVPENNSDHENSPTPSVGSPGVSDPNDSVTDDDHDIYSPPQPRRRRGADVRSTQGRAMRARGRGRGRGRGGGRGRGRMRGQGTRGTRRGGRTACSVQANPVDDKWKWLSTYANDSSISSPPVFNVESGPSAEAKCCDCPGDFFRLLFTDELVDTIVKNTKVHAALCVLPREAG